MLLSIESMSPDSDGIKNDTARLRRPMLFGESMPDPFRLMSLGVLVVDELAEFDTR
jgi:hypothetical protein